jgi:hypothetical protein
MKTNPLPDERGQTVGFVIDNVYVSLSTVVRVLSHVDGVSDVRKRRLFSKWNEIHIWFRYKNQVCVVWEPHGDSSEYWIGQESPTPVDLTDVDAAFRDYKPPIHRQLLGDILSLRVFKRLFGLDEK